MKHPQKPESDNMEQAKNLEAYKAILDIEQQTQNLKDKRSYWKAYILSVILPPIGIYYFIKYFFFSEGTDSRKAGVVSLVLTIASLIVNLWLIQLFLNQSIGENSQNLNIIKELITPENQKSLQQLLQ